MTFWFVCYQFSLLWTISFLFNNGKLIKTNDDGQKGVFWFIWEIIDYQIDFFGKGVYISIYMKHILEFFFVYIHSKWIQVLNHALYRRPFPPISMATLTNHWRYFLFVYLSRVSNFLDRSSDIYKWWWEKVVVVWFDLYMRM